MMFFHRITTVEPETHARFLFRSDKFGGRRCINGSEAEGYSFVFFIIVVDLFRGISTAMRIRAKDFLLSDAAFCDSTAPMNARTCVHPTNQSPIKALSVNPQICR